METIPLFPIILTFLICVFIRDLIFGEKVYKKIEL